MAIAIAGQSSPLRVISNSGDTFLSCPDVLDGTVIVITAFVVAVADQ
jgi:hypothetical protein